MVQILGLIFPIPAQFIHSVNISDFFSPFIFQLSFVT